MLGSLLTKFKHRLHIRRQTAVIRDFFNAEWYLAANSDVRAERGDPIRHYLQHGWKEGRDPSPLFGTNAYLALNPDVAASGQNPFVHYIKSGLREGRRTGDAGESSLARAAIDANRQSSPSLHGQDPAVIRHFFNEDWYLQVYSDVRTGGSDPVQHYLEHGWKEGRDPSPLFSTNAYLALNPDVAASGQNPFVHYIKHGLREGRRTGEAGQSSVVRISNDVHARAFHSVQDQSFPTAAEQAENLLVIIVPEHNAMSGGIYSFFSIAKTIYNLRFKHNYTTILMTRNNYHDVTYTRQKNFRNSEDVFRFEQIERCKKARNVYIHIPEYAAPDFIKDLHKDTVYYLKSREKLYINILNQKIDIMPEREAFDDLRAIADEVSQSVAHHAYFSQAFADRYDLPTLLLPAYTDLSNYAASAFEDKEKLIIYSPDDSPWRKAALEKLGRDLPDYELREIRDITFDQFMDLATRCRFSITFGEGFDGYLAQPIHQGGLSFAVYNEEFFPSPELRDFANIFSSAEDLLDNIVSRIRALEADPEQYRKANRAMIDVYDGLYSKEEYVQRVLKLVNREFEYFPLHLSCAGAAGRL